MKVEMKVMEPRENDGNTRGGGRWDRCTSGTLGHKWINWHTGIGEMRELTSMKIKIPRFRPLGRGGLTGIYKITNNKSSSIAS